jgi:hypothetical protein
MKKDAQQIWFKAKRYGGGWYPATWEGWMVTLVFVFAIVGVTQTYSLSKPGNMIPFTISMLLAIGLLLFIASTKGEKPSWRWDGKPAFKK